MNPFRLPTGSALDRVMRCPESHAMPSVRDLRRARWRDTGKTFHVFGHRIGEEGPEARGDALAAIPDDDPGKALCEEFDVTLIPRGGHFEPAFAYDPETGVARFIGENIDREYEAHGVDMSREIAMSGDFFGVHQTLRAAVVNDFKTGRPGPVRDSWQMKALAVAAAGVAGVDEVIASHQVVRGPSIWWDTKEWDAIDLNGFRAELRDLGRRLRSLPQVIDPQHANVVEGDWCKYCPAFNRCPAKTGLVREMSQMLVQLHGATPTIADSEEAVQVWLALDHYDALAKRMREQVEKIAEVEPLNLGNGYELRLCEGDPKEKVVDPAGALAMLATLTSADAARAASSTSKKGIATAVRAWARDNGEVPAKAEERVLKALRDAKLIKEEVGEQRVREVKVR